MDPVQRPIPTPLVEVAPDGALGREIDGQIAPLAAGAEDVEDGVEDVPHVCLAGPTAAGFGRHVGLDQGPLRVGDVAGVMVHSHTNTTLVTPRLFSLWDRLLESPIIWEMWVGICTVQWSCADEGPLPRLV